MIFVGIDVGAPQRGQAIAIMNEHRKVNTLQGSVQTEEILKNHIIPLGTDVIVAIDAPRKPIMSFNGRGGRECERELHRRGLRLFWTPTKRQFERNPSRYLWMQAGFELFKLFEKQKTQKAICDVIEVFPSASYGNFSKIVQAVPFHLIDRRTKADQLDAICCALTAWYYHNEKYEAVGDEKEGQIIIPAP